MLNANPMRLTSKEMKFPSGVACCGLPNTQTAFFSQLVVSTVASETCLLAILNKPLCFWLSAFTGARIYLKSAFIGVCFCNVTTLLSDQISFTFLNLSILVKCQMVGKPCAVYPCK